MGGHGHEPPYKVPSPDHYKLEDAPELLKYQQKLAKIGLKDPWIRNHIWRYDKKYGTITSRWFWLMIRGVPTGLAAFGLTLAIENALGIDYHPWLHEHNDHGHGEKSH
ncbi:hypothetical protein PV325_004164 [Microctonus aethiopoides]|uniref:NADH dehydrogenase [ubiquinone] 1 beta subcomplex subunit 3 n=1 Tax=Microctonus aethiopoides TaxID=144406 RepID=A0AA39EZD0_9HYME|nr:hypothetical protein PV325_004164 [Microctonus aethiopoides]KAK0094674.1 hypothetical protein PV326_010322 [Microctonus aethiopoides]KAK0158625.1 hypothetical protein PV328_009603 [Microctonus aethiopoides]